ncbi:LysR family transcriptional regulator, partial [Streptomyces sp. NPDC057705]
MLDVRHLQVLRSIAQEGSLAVAGRALHYNQPTITPHLG